jgi:hypothetical protein
VASCTNGYGGASEKSPGQRQRLVDTRAGVPEGCQQHLAVKIRHVMEQGADFRRQQVFRQFILHERHLAQGEGGRVIDGHREQCSGRCRRSNWNQVIHNFC